MKEWLGRQEPRWAAEWVVTMERGTGGGGEKKKRTNEKTIHIGADTIQKGGKRRGRATWWRGGCKLCAEKRYNGKRRSKWPGHLRGKMAINVNGKGVEPGTNRAGVAACRGRRTHPIGVGPRSGGWWVRGGGAGPPPLSQKKVLTRKGARATKNAGGQKSKTGEGGQKRKKHVSNGEGQRAKKHVKRTYGKYVHS